MAPKAHNKPWGGHGVPFVIYPSSLSPVKRFEAWSYWVDPSKGSGDGKYWRVTAVQFTWFNGECSGIIGNTTLPVKDYTLYHKVHTFDENERITQMTVKYGAEFDSLYFKTDAPGKQPFDMNNDSGRSEDMYLGNGLLLGCAGTQKDGDTGMLLSFGPIFMHANILP